MRRTDFEFDSRDGRTKLKAHIWEPDEGVAVTGILQIVHGMAEHSLRYEDFAEFLCKNGYVVAAEDHLGHGESIKDRTPGYFCKNNPASVVVKDVHRLKKIVEEKYPKLPYYILGHSMGSFILRNYLFTYGKGIDGAIIMGTGMQPKLMVLGLCALANIGCIFGKADKPSILIEKVGFSSYNNRIDKPLTQYDWLSTNRSNIDKYMADPLSGFVFPCNGFKTLGGLLLRLYKKSNVEKMPVSLRVLITSGEEDPVGDYGQGPTKVYKQFVAEGMQKVSLKLYPGDRHEILNETDKETVYNDILTWLSGE